MMPGRVWIYGAEEELQALPVLACESGLDFVVTADRDALLRAVDGEVPAGVIAAFDQFVSDEHLRELPCSRIAVASSDAVGEVLAAFGDCIDDCLFSPLRVPELMTALSRSRPRKSSAPRSSSIIGTSSGLLKAWQTLERAAAFDTDVLICGESGTGKELFARALHDLSKRHHAPFVAINCAAIPRELLESELFGHVKGAFTDAHSDHRGVFARAHGGTLFLDEIGDFPSDMQAKLLRVLQSGELQPVGSETVSRVDVRVVSATSRDLRARIATQEFREDLYYRLAVIPIDLPPLRQRKGDLSELIDHFLCRFRDKHGLAELSLTPAARERLIQAPWPGNVRQLQNAIERLAVLAETPIIDEALVVREVRHQEEVVSPEERCVSLRGRPLREAMRRLEGELIAEALAACAGKRAKCAELLSISQRSLLYKLKEHDLR